MAVRLATHKIPDIILSVKKSLNEKIVELHTIDIYVHLLAHLSEKECYYLQTNRSTEFYDSDLDFLIAVLSECLKVYEVHEEYEFCVEIYSAIQKYSGLLTI